MHWACSVFIHPHTQQEHAGAFDAAMAGLRYGSISVNCTATAAFSVTSLPWGAFPGEQVAPGGGARPASLLLVADPPYLHRQHVGCVLLRRVMQVCFVRCQSAP